MEPRSEPTSRVVFAAVGFDVFANYREWVCRGAGGALPMACPVNYNMQFADDRGEEVTFMSECTCSTSLFQCRTGL